MQLCANARLLLDMVAASGQPKLWELTPPEARKKVIELTRMVECEEAIGKIEDRTLPGPAVVPRLYAISGQRRAVRWRNLFSRRRLGIG
jgi:hypothetical protein